MPIHDYECIKCKDQKLDIFYPSDRDHEIFEEHVCCGRCGGKLRRLPSRHTSFRMDKEKP